jgi:LmbE family N-acetylglucosaminyl deacetylase
LTFEPRGISGHLDHIAVSLVTTYVFNQLSFIKELYYYCLTEKQRNTYTHAYFIYRPPGYKQTEISLTVDTTKVWETKLKAMNQHQSQKHDIKRLLGFMKNLPKEENFMVLQK